MLALTRATAPIVCCGVLLAAAVVALVGCSGDRGTTHFAEDQTLLEYRLNDRDAKFNTEEYDDLPENRFIVALDQPQSTFAIDVDTAAYSNLRRLLNSRTLPAKGAVRIEELVNYFPYAYPQPIGEHPLDVYLHAAACPWQADHQLVRVAMKGKSVARQERASANLVFLIDVSGSMDSEDKLPLVQQSLKLLVKELKPDDRVAIVVYAGSSGCPLPSTPVSRSAKIFDAIEDMRAGGSTNGAAGIQQAYQIAEKNFIEDGINRVILCTDGDFNVGVTNRSDLVDLVAAKAKTNVFLTVLSFGTGNLKDAMMERLADRGNGNYAYIDSLLEARKVLSQQLGSTLNTIAKDVKIQVDFNPNLVNSYRLLGYENRLMTNQEFRDDARDAGELGADHTVTAFYEVVPASIPNQSNVRPSEFVTSQPKADHETLLTVNLRYKLPASETATEFQRRLLLTGAEDSDSAEADGDFQFATAVLGYGLLLRESQYKGALNWDWVLKTARQNQGQDSQGLRQEFIGLVRKAQKLQSIQQKSE